MFWWKRWRRNRLAGKQFPDEWLRIIDKNVPFYKKLAAEDQKELQRHILIFLGEKRFEGCAGLRITDEIKTTIAAQACILLLHRKTDYYPGLSSILVYPQAYVAREVRQPAPGIMTEEDEVRMGESWHHGSVVLSWDDVQHGAGDVCDGHNVVFHEFAHQLDSSAARRDSTPVLLDRSTYVAWARVLERDYQKLRRDVARHRPTLLDKYGATDPAEFFAVATECFFERPSQLRQLHRELYEDLRLFYQQDPAEL